MIIDAGRTETGDGKERRVPCPFHPETGPTLAVDLETGHYHCHHCGASGILTPKDASTLRMEFHWWSFI